MSKKSISRLLLSGVVALSTFAAMPFEANTGAYLGYGSYGNYSPSIDISRYISENSSYYPILTEELGSNYVQDLNNFSSYFGRQMQNYMRRAGGLTTQNVTVVVNNIMDQLEDMNAGWADDIMECVQDNVIKIVIGANGCVGLQIGGGRNFIPMTRNLLGNRRPKRSITVNIV